MKSQKIYICYHPDESEYYDMISQEITELVGSAVFQKHIGKESEAYTIVEGGHDIDLLIVVLTTKSLASSKEVLEPALQMARDKMIPIIPISFENCSDEEINDLLNNLEYISYIGGEDLSIFRRKLERYLSVYFPNKMEYERIRGAFKRRAFLSYRGKNRKDVRSFIDRINSDDRFVDMSLWWDACLNPGENFDNEIKQAIYHSNIFILFVTQDILDDDNYVLKIEWPLALKRKDLHILLIELEEINHCEFEKRYGAEPSLYYMNVDEAVEELAKLHFSRKESPLLTPEENYLLGMAYLLGVDTEINYTLAVRLIKTAEIEGDIEATRELAVMSIYGHGQKRDLENAINWMNAYVNLLQSSSTILQKKDELMELCHGLYKLVDMYLTSPNAQKDRGTSQVWSRREAIDALRQAILWCRHLLEMDHDDLEVVNMLMRYYGKEACLIRDCYPAMWGRVEKKDIHDLINKALGYALSLDELILMQIKKGEMKDGIQAAWHWRLQNIVTIIGLYSGLNDDKSMWSWMRIRCEISWYNLINNPYGHDNSIWAEALLDGIKGIVHFLNCDGKFEKAREVYELFYNGSILEYVDDSNWKGKILREDYKRFGCGGLIEYYVSKKNVRKAKELLLWMHGVTDTE